MQNDLEAYTECNVKRNIDEAGNVILRVISSEYDLNNVLILKNDTKNIVFNGEIIGYFTTSVEPLSASDSWNFLGTTNYKITATGAGITATVLTILSGIMGGGLAASLVAGLSAFVGTSVSGGTLTVSIWDRTIASRYHQKYRVKFTTSTGEVWGPIESIKAY